MVQKYEKNTNYDCNATLFFRKELRITIFLSILLSRWLNNVKTSQLSIINYQLSIKKSYLCSRFPRNRWQEITRGLLCCAWNDTVTS